MWASAHWLPAAALVVPAKGVFAVAFALLGAGIALAGMVAFHRRKTSFDPIHPQKATVLVIEGIFRFTRNPMYLGLALLLASWACLLENVIAALFLPLFILYMTRFQIRPEERELLVIFGNPYREYVQNVHRWL